MNRYIAFLKVFERNSFSDAARDLGYTQSAVSQMIKSLEEELGVPCTAVATGGLAGVITPYCRRDIRRDDSLLLRGLALIWRKNCGNR